MHLKNYNYCINFNNDKNYNDIQNISKIIDLFNEKYTKFNIYYEIINNCIQNAQLCYDTIDNFIKKLC